MEEKLRTLSDSIKLIEDGNVIAIGNQKPMALIREIVRQKKKDLTIYIMTGDYEVDLLCGAGSVAEVHGLFVSPLGGPHFRQSVQAGKVRMIDEGEVPLNLAILAGSMNLPFIPLKGYQNDIVTIHTGWKKFKSPLANEDLLAIPALVPDVALVHMPRADIYGNVQAEDAFTHDRVMGWWDKRISMAARMTIVSVDEIIDHERIRANPDRTYIPFYEVNIVTEARRGAHPRALPGSYGADITHAGIYSKACQDSSTYSAYLDKYVYGTKDNNEYLSLVDADAQGRGY